MTITGDSKENSLADLIQANALGRNTCRVTVATSNGRGTFHMVDGEIVDASFGDLAGEPAFYALLNGSDATFSASSGMKPSGRTIETGLQTLMLNAMTLRFEGRVPVPSFPPPREPSPFETGPIPGSTLPVPRTEADPLARTLTLPVSAVPDRVRRSDSPVPAGSPASISASPSPQVTRPAASPAPPVRAERAVPAASVPRGPASPLPRAGSSKGPTKKGVGPVFIAAGLLLLVAAGAHFLLGRSPANAGPNKASASPASAVPIEPVESALLTGPGDVQPELQSGETPRSPDPESAISPTVVCRILIGEDGVVKEASVFRSRLDLARFEEAAISAIKVYRFRPGRRAGRAVPVWTNFPVSFR